MSQAKERPAFRLAKATCWFLAGMMSTILVECVQAAKVDTIHLERDMDICTYFNGSHSNIKVFEKLSTSLRHS